MMQNDKRVFVDDLCWSITNTIKENVAKMPEEWDGHELRQYIRDKYAELSTCGDGLKGKRLKAYKNEVIVRNL